MLELHYFLLGIVIVLALVYYKNEKDLNFAMVEKFNTGRDELKSVIADGVSVGNGKPDISACKKFNYGRLIALEDPNIPLDKQTIFQTEAEDEDHMVNRVGKLDDDIVSDKGKYCFGKGKLLFDGIWDRTCEQQGLERDCKWNMIKGTSEWTGGWDRHSVPKRCPSVGNEGSYCADNFFHFPEKCLAVGQDVFTGDQCDGVGEGKGDGKVCCYEGTEKYDPTIVQA